MMRRLSAVACLLCLLSLFALGCGALHPREHSEDEESVLLPTAYHITAELLPKERALSTRTEIVYSVPSDGISAIKLRLYANVYREGNEVVTTEKKAQAYGSAGENYGGAEITKAESDAPLLDHTLGQNDTTLTLRFGRSFARGERVSFTIETRVTLARIRHRLGYYDGYYSLSCFYPEVCPFRDGKYVAYDYTPYGDPFLRDVADFTLDLTLPATYECACSAVENLRDYQGTIAHYSYALQGARDLAFVASHKLRYRSASVGDIPIRYYFEKDESPSRTLDRITRSVALYQELFGAYPYPSYTVAVAPFFEAGIEHSGLSVISDALSDTDRRRTVLHETAHQWWYGKVGSDEYLHPWIDEGLAEYGVACYYRAEGSDAAYRTMIARAEDDFAIRLALEGSEGARFDRPLSELAEGYDDRVYSGGLLLFSSLAEKVGFDAFHAALRTFAERYDGEVASPEDLIRTLSESLCEDYTDYFRLWTTATLPIP